MLRYFYQIVILFSLFFDWLICWRTPDLSLVLCSQSRDSCRLHFDKRMTDLLSSLSGLFKTVDDSNHRELQLFPINSLKTIFHPFCAVQKCFTNTWKFVYNSFVLKENSRELNTNHSCKRLITIIILIQEHMSLLSSSSCCEYFYLEKKNMCLIIINFCVHFVKINFHFNF